MIDVFFLFKFVKVLSLSKFVRYCRGGREGMGVRKWYLLIFCEIDSLGRLGYTCLECLGVIYTKVEELGDVVTCLRLYFFYVIKFKWVVLEFD